MSLTRPDLRTRIAVVLATVCIGVVGALGILLYMASEEMQEALVEQLVTEELDALTVRARAGSTLVSGGGPNLQYYVFKVTEAPASLPEQLRTLSPGHHEVGRGADERHVAVRDEAGVRYVVVYDSGPHELREARFRRLLLLALCSAAVIAVVLGYWLARVLTRQLTALAAQVRVLAPDEPLPPLERADHDTEVAALAHALDDYRGRIVETMQRDQEFTANASHELRTPLTAIRTSCELLRAIPALPDKASRRITMIDDAARQMTERIEALLMLARPHHAGEIEAVNLRRCVEETAAPFRDEMARKGLMFEVSIAQDETARLDRKALQVVLANLIKNAVTYTERGYVRVTGGGGRVTVTDSGAGIADEHRTQVFTRHFRADSKPEGLGIGLAIVRRVCDDLQWRIEVESTPGEGSAFSVVYG
jgi:signal transduction histidine kinase